jgi:DNA-binding cell septation regulator SpoVG
MADRKIDQAVCARMWDQLNISVDRFSTKLQPEWIREKTTFLGYADITVDATAALPGLKFKLRGIEVKQLKGNDHIDMPSERGSDGVHYPRYFPLTGEFRAVLTTAIFQNSHVQAAVEAAAQLRAQVGAQAGGEAPASSSNPFAS